MDFIVTISDAFFKGGLWMWVILGLQVATIAIIIERYAFLFKAHSIGERKHVNQYERSIRAGETDRYQKQSP